MRPLWLRRFVRLYSQAPPSAEAALRQEKREALIQLRDGVSDFALQLAKWFGFWYCVSEFVIDITFPTGPSMIPTINPKGDVVLCEHISPLMGKLKVGDVVACRSPIDRKQTIVKRIVGMPGDTITIGAGENTASFQVPPGHVWLQGDNIYNSRDSRHYGPVPIALVIGRTFWKIWPLKEFGPIKRTPEYSTRSSAPHP